MTTTTLPEAAAAPTEAALRAFCAREHPACFACRPAAQGGLGLRCFVQLDGSVSADWTCPPGGESYAGVVHGGLLATTLDSAMVHALFARGVVAYTAELRVRYRHPVRVGHPVRIAARLRTQTEPLWVLDADLRQHDVVCATAQAKFLASEA